MTGSIWLDLAAVAAIMATWFWFGCKHGRGRGHRDGYQEGFQAGYAAHEAEDLLQRAEEVRRRQAFNRYIAAEVEAAIKDVEGARWNNN